ncbi:replication protein A 70 kDa DNA-binding subunit, partial [Striga asiatica]
ECTSRTIMSTTLNSIGEITKEKETWRIRVRCLRVWFKHVLNQPEMRQTMEICIVDEHGDKIQATIPKWHISKFEEIILEGNFYVMGNFEILDNTDDYSATPHKCLLKFHNLTSVKLLLENLNIPRYMFNFVTFDELRNNHEYNSRLFDVIAEVYDVDELVKMDRDGNQLTRIKIHLRNLSGDTMHCTLWNKFAMQMTEFWKSNNDVPVVIILQYAMVKRWGAHVNLQNSLFASKLMINEDVGDIALTRYRVHVRVEDNTGSASFILFDPQVFPIIGKRAADLKHSLDMAGDGDSFPDELEQLVKKSYLFKLDIKRFNLNQRIRVYTVAKLTQDATIISKWCNAVCDDMTTTKDKSPVESSAIEPFIELDTSIVSSVGDSAKGDELTPSSNKRVAVDNNLEAFVDEDFHSQQSCTRKNAKVKVEKIDI